MQNQKIIICYLVLFLFFCSFLNLFGCRIYNISFREAEIFWKEGEERIYEKLDSEGIDLPYYVYEFWIKIDCNKVYNSCIKKFQCFRFTRVDIIECTNYFIVTDFRNDGFVNCKLFKLT
ncbi:hypothetical protein KAT08_04555 [Candidatus Babeliales bacterium]|nr:hypothetical protein [Candidatus Babeliales bacterium]